MSDELHKYPGNLKHHKVEPLLTNVLKEAMCGDLLNAEQVSKYALGEAVGRRMGVEIARDFYEHARAKDAELIQALVDEVAKWMGPNIDERFRGPEWYKSKSVLDAAAASGFKPSEQ